MHIIAIFIVYPNCRTILIELQKLRALDELFKFDNLFALLQERIFKNLI